VPPEPQPARPREVVLVRHATTADTRAGLLSGHEPTPLDDRGRAQAERIGTRLQDRRFEQVLVSPVARARETATLARLAGPTEVDDALAEWRYGELAGRRSADVRAADPDWRLWDHGAPGGERPAEVEARLRPVLDRLRVPAGGDVVVVSHGHVLRALIVGWLGLPVTDAGALVVDPASVSVLGVRHGRPALVLLNDRSHLLPDAG
jgi:probable phosphoglycerate mutase